MASAEGKPRIRKRYRRLRAAYSFIGGSLIGIAGSLTAFALNPGEDGGTLTLLVSLTLASTGIGIHLNGSKRPAQRITH
jgi:hypothetical protein